MICTFFLLQSLQDENIISQFEKIVESDKDNYESLMSSYPELPGNEFKFCFAHKLVLKELGKYIAEQNPNHLNEVVHTFLKTLPKTRRSHCEQNERSLERSNLALDGTQINPCVDRRFRYDPTKSKGVVPSMSVEDSIINVGEIMTSIQLNDWILINQPPYICRVIEFCKQSKTNKISDKTYWSRVVNLDNCQKISLYGQFYKINDEGKLQNITVKESLITCDKYAGHLPAPLYPGPVYNSTIRTQISNIVSKIE